MTCCEETFTCIFISVTREEEEEVGESDGTKDKQHQLSPKLGAASCGANIN